jgi:hypothetical protein
MTSTLKRRLAKLEASGPAEMPAELEGVFEALLASRAEYAGLGPMSPEQRAIREAPDFQARVRAAGRWGKEHPSKEPVFDIAAALTRPRAGR